MSFFPRKRNINFKHLIATCGSVDVGATSVGANLLWGETGSYHPVLIDED